MARTSGRALSDQHISRAGGHALRLLQRAGGHNIEAVKLGKSVGHSEASRRLGIPDSSLFNWVKLERAGKLGAANVKKLRKQRHARNYVG